MDEPFWSAAQRLNAEIGEKLDALDEPLQRLRQLVFESNSFSEDPFLAALAVTTLRVGDMTNSVTELVLRLTDEVLRGPTTG